MKSFWVSFFALLLTYQPAQSQVRLLNPQLELNAGRDSLVLSFQLLYFRTDTALNSRELLVHTNAKGIVIPVMLNKDSIFLKRGITMPFRRSIPVEQCLDSNLIHYWRMLNQIPDISFGFYSSYGEGKKTEVKTVKSRDPFSVDLHPDPLSDSSFLAYPDTGNQEILLQVDYLIQLDDSMVILPYDTAYTASDTLKVLGIESKFESSSIRSAKLRFSYLGFPVYYSGKLSKKEMELLFQSDPKTKARINNPLKYSLIHAEQIGPSVSKYKIPLLRGEVTSESQLQNYQNLLSIRPVNYSRFYINARINTLLPIKLSGFLSTENSSHTNLNSFKVSFDQAALAERKALRIAESEDKLTQKLRDQEKKLEGLENEAFATKQGMLQSILTDSALSNRKDKVIEFAILALQDSIERNRKQLNDSLANHNSLGLETSWNSQTSQRLDSMNARLERLRGIQDSINRMNDSLSSQIEEQKRRYDQIQRQIKSAKEAIEQLNALKDQLKRLKDPSTGLSLKTIQAGRINPRMSPLTAQGVMVQGVETEISVDSWAVKMFGGKTCKIPDTKAFITPAELDKSFTRNAYGVQLTHHAPMNNDLAFTFNHYFDPKHLKSNTHQNNQVFSLAHEGELVKDLQLKTELAYSKTKVMTGINSENAMEISNSEGLALNFETIYHFGNYDFNLAYNRVHPRYFSLGNPYLRSNYHEVKSGAKGSFFRKTITVKLEYSISKDNLDHSRNYSNTLQGWSLQLNTAFKKYPNLTLSYIPYSNTSYFNPTPYSGDLPPSVLINPYYQTTSSALLMANLNYALKLKSLMLAFNSMLTSSQVGYGDQVFRQNAINTNIMTYYDKHQLSYKLTISKTETFSAIDTTGFRSSELIWAYQFKRLQILAGVGSYWYPNGYSVLYQKMGISGGINSWVFQWSLNLGKQMQEIYFPVKFLTTTQLVLGYRF